jgi:protein SCO1/2
LVDYQGRPTSLAAFHGRIIVLSDMLTLCQETCPLDTANLVATARAVPPDEHVAFVSVTVDPERDTVPRLAAYRALFAPPPANWTTLTGSPATLDRLWQWFGVYHRKVAEQAPAPRDWLTGQPLTYDVTHSDLVFFVGPDGTDRFVLDGAAHVARGDQLPATLSGFLNDEGRRNLAHPEAGTWTVDQALAALAWLSS